MVSSDGSTDLVATIGIFISVLSFVVSIKTLYRTESSLALTKDSLALTEESLILSMCERKRKDLVDSLKYFYYPFISFWGGWAYMKPSGKYDINLFNLFNTHWFYCYPGIVDVAKE